jgi:hypothetical protein
MVWFPLCFLMVENGLFADFRRPEV